MSVGVGVDLVRDLQQHEAVQRETQASSPFMREASTSITGAAAACEPQ